MKRLLQLFFIMLCTVLYFNHTACIAQHTALGFHGRMSAPVGDFADEAKLGFGGGATARFFTRYNMVFDLGFNYAIYPLKTSQLTNITSADFRVLEFKMGLFYMLGKGEVRPYAGLTGGLGLFNSRVKTSFQEQTLDMGSAFQICPTIGFMIMASDRVGIDINAGYMINFSKTSASSVNYAYNITYIPFNLGFSYLIGYKAPSK